ncbi:hypothetical protein HOC80_00445 [archaeon]|jgi:hypothetical protein|nr:hypothetical protein [archaeon]MBT4416554.1 hypothetical protein [archaeon]
MGIFKKKPSKEKGKKREGLIKKLPDIKTLVTELNTILHDLMSNLDKNFSIEKLNRIAELLQQIYGQLNSKKADIQRETPQLYDDLILLIAKSHLIFNEVNHIPKRNKEEAEIYLEAILQEIISLVDDLFDLLTKIETRLRASKVVIWRIIKTRQYKNGMKKQVYATNETLIKETESRIIEYFRKGGLPGLNNLAKIDPIGLTGHLHSSIPKPLDNHRILYNVDISKRKIELIKIDTHKGLGFGGSGS